LAQLPPLPQVMMFPQPSEWLPQTLPSEVQVAGTQQVSPLFWQIPPLAHEPTLVPQVNVLPQPLL
jgi:leucyl-tRNA synthetase